MKKDINPEYLACPIRQVISRFCDKWSMLVLYALDRSDTGVIAHRLGQEALRRGGQVITVAIMLQCCFCHFFEVTKLIA